MTYCLYTNEHVCSIGVAKEVLNRCMTVTVDGQLKIDYSFVDITNKLVSWQIHIK